MSSWEKFSSEIVEGKKKPALDPVGQEDADINNDGKEDETDSYLKNRRRVRSRIIKKEDYEPLEEKAVSKAQQRFFGMVRAAQKGEMEDPSPEVSKAAASMSKSDVKDFAKTKHAKLPEKKETKEETSLVDDIVENLRAQRLKRQAKRQLAQAKQARRTSAYRDKTIDDLLTKGKVNDAAGKSKRVEVKAPANVKVSKRGTKLTAKQQADLEFKREKEAAVDRRNTERQEDQRASTKARQQEVRRSQNQERTRRKERREDQATARAEKAAAAKAAARDDFLKKETEKNIRIAKAQEAEKGAGRKAFGKEILDTGRKIADRAASKKDDTGAQAVRSLDTAADAIGGLGRGIVKGIMAKRAAKKEVEKIQKDDDIRKKAESDAKKAYGKSLRDKAEDDAKKDMKSDDDKFGDNKPKAQGKSKEETLDNLLKDKEGFQDMKDAQAQAGLEKLTGMKSGQKVEKPAPKQIKGTEVKGALTGSRGSEQAKSARMPGGKSRAVPFKAPTPPAQRPAIPMGGASPKRPALPPAKSGSSATSGGARLKSPGQVARDKKKNDPQGFQKLMKDRGMGSAKRPKPKGFKEGFSNWRSELNESFFLQEVEDVENNGLHSNIKKLVDISKKKNKIEINPALGEGALPVKPIVGSFAQGEAGKGDSNRTMGDVAKRRIRRKLVDWASQKAGEKAEDIVKNILDKKKEGEEVKEAFKDGEMKPQLKKKKGNIQVVDTGNTLKKSVDNQINTDPDLTLIKKKLKEDWQKVNRKDKTDGLSQKAVDAYRKENPGSKLQTAVTEKKPTGKRADRRKSFCRRMKGMKAKLTSKKTSRDPDSKINKALRRWNCN